MDYQTFTDLLSVIDWPILFTIWIGVGVVVALLLGAVIERGGR